MKTLELTLHDGKRVGIPSGTVILISSADTPPDPQWPKAQTFIRYTMDGQGHKVVAVRDPYKQVLSQVPRPMNARGWAHLTSKNGMDVAIAAESGVAYEEVGGGIFSVTFSVPTGPLELHIRASYEEVKALLRPDEPDPVPAEEDEGPATPAPAAESKRRAARKPAE